MRAILIGLLLLGSLAVLAPVEAHSVGCNFGDMSCWAKCQVGHVKYLLDEEHDCYWVIGPYPTP